MSTLRVDTLQTTDSSFTVDVKDINKSNTDLAEPFDVTKGATLVGYAGRTVRSALSDRVNVVDYLFDGSGNARTQTQAAQAAATVALSSGKSLYFPGGVSWNLTSAITGTGSPIQIIGDGVSSTIVSFSSTSGGFSFLLNPQLTNIAPQKASISGMTIKAASGVTVSSPAVSFEWVSYQANAQGSFWASDLNITRADDGTGSFTAGLKLNKCFVGFIDRCTIVGDDLRVSNYGVWLVDCVGLRCVLDVNRYKEGVRIDKVSASQTEGILIHNSYLYDVNYGVNSPSASIHVNVVNSHININSAAAAAGITLTSASQTTLAGNLIYTGGNTGDAINQDGIRLVSSNSNTIVNNQINGLNIARSRYGIVTTSTCSYNTIGLNNINNVITGVNLSGAGDTGNRIAVNDFFGCTTNITDAGVSNTSDVNTSAGVAISGLHWGGGKFAAGEISSDTNHGGYIRGKLGTNEDLALVDSSNVISAVVKSGVMSVRNYTKTTLPSANSVAGYTGMIGVTDDVGGYTLAFSDGTSWRRVADRAVIA